MYVKTRICIRRCLDYIVDYIVVRAMLKSGGDAVWTAGDAERNRLSREEDLYKQEMLRLEKDLT